jgi:hypothetical protein
MIVPRGPRVVASLVGIAAALVAPSARAERPGIGVRYGAPSGCPTEVEFLDNVRQRSPRVVAASALDPPQFLVTVAEGASPRFTGRLERVTSTGAIGVREISGESCREVTAALALITALTADLTPPAVPSADPGPTGVGAAGRTTDPATSSVTLSDKEADKEAEPPKEPSVTPAASRGVANVRWQAGLDGMLASGVTPDPLTGVTLFGQAGGRGSGLWVPSFRLSASLAGSSWSSAVTSARADFLWAVASLDACPLQLGDPVEVSVQPCARVTAGLLRASGSGRANPHEESVLWSDAGGLFRVHGQLGRMVFLDGEAGVFVPRVRYQFDFTKPSDTAEVRGALGFRIAAGIGLMFR